MIQSPELYTYKRLLLYRELILPSQKIFYPNKHYHPSTLFVIKSILTSEQPQGQRLMLFYVLKWNRTNSTKPLKIKAKDEKKAAQHNPDSWKPWLSEFYCHRRVAVAFNLRSSAYQKTRKANISIGIAKSWPGVNQKEWGRTPALVWEEGRTFKY